MLDPFVFDQNVDDEEAINVAMEKARKNRKKIKTLLAVTAMVRSQCGDYFEDNDWEEDWDDEIYNC